MRNNRTEYAYFHRNIAQRRVTIPRAPSVEKKLRPPAEEVIETRSGLTDQPISLLNQLLESL